MPRPSLRMSALGKCKRQTAYKILRIPQSDPTTKESLLNFRRGNELERTLARRLVGMGRDLRYTNLTKQKAIQMEVKGIPMTGHPDGFEYLGPKKWELAEIKTGSKRVFTRWKNHGVAAVRPNYLGQVFGYMAATGIWLARFWVADRDRIPEGAEITDELAEKSVFSEELEFDLLAWEETVEGWQEVWPTIVKGDLPRADYNGDDWHCSPKYCNWSSICPSGKKYQRNNAGK